MANQITTTSLRDMNSVVSSEGFIMLMDIVFNDGAGETRYRVAENKKDVISNGITYTAYAFAIVLGNQDGETLPKVKLTIDNIDGLLIVAVRSFVKAPTITLQLVPISNPDVPEIVLNNLTMREINYDAFTINGSLHFADVLHQRCPADDYTPENVPGLF